MYVCIYIYIYIYIWHAVQKVNVHCNVHRNKNTGFPGAPSCQGAPSNQDPSGSCGRIPSRQGAPRIPLRTATNLCTKILDFRRFDSSRILILRGGILMPVRNFPELLSQRILAGIVLVGRLGLAAHPASAARPDRRQLREQLCDMFPA